MGHNKNMRYKRTSAAYTQQGMQVQYRTQDSDCGPTAHLCKVVCCSHLHFS